MTMLPEETPASTAQKPGYKTTEFWLTILAMLVGVLLSSDVFPDGGPVVKGLGLVASILGLLGYQVQRGLVKASGNKAAAFVEAAKAAPAANPSQPSTSG
jgi:hypothetical protein